MAKWLYATGVGGSVASGLTRWYPLAGSPVQENATESLSQTLLRSSYTGSNMMINVTAVTGTATVTSRKNAGAGSQTISVTTTGQKEDTTHTDTLVSGDLINYQIAMSAGHSDTVTFKSLSTLLDDSGANVPIVTGTCFAADPASSGTVYGRFTGHLETRSTTEANHQVTLRATATLTRFRVWIDAQSGTSTMRTRINAADGGQSVSVASTGSKEDTSGSDSVVSGDLLAWQQTGGTNAKARVAQMQLATTLAPNAFASEGGITAIGASVTRYIALGGALGASTSTTEGDAQVKARVADTWSLLESNVVSNSRSDATTIDFRVGAASPGGGPTLSVAGGATGIKVDLTGTYTSSATDLMNYRLLTGGGTGTIVVSTVGVHQGTVVTPALGFHLPVFPSRREMFC